MLSLFTFKKDLKKVFNEENIKNLKEKAVFEIIKQVEKQISGEKKKQLVIASVSSFILRNFVTKNSIVNFLVGLLIQFVPQIVQYLYDSLAEYVDGLTKAKV